MCGLAGILSPTALSEPEARLATMARQLIHRGPDDEGLWWDEAAGIGLAHRRLAIVDLSSAGHQPMASHSGRYVLTYNGEVYNHAELRAELPADLPWRGHSDTETLLAGITHWGLEATLTRCRGMWALALWDREQQTLTLARDRMGEKPLYYGMLGGEWLFGSELKALLAASARAPEEDPQSVALFLRYGYVPSPRSIWKGIFKLPPGHVVSLRQGESLAPQPKAWWRFDEMALQAAADPQAVSDEQALDALEQTLGAAVAEQGLADVPLGALLSGGIDSSLIVALMQRHAGQPVRSFTVGFEESGYDEAVHAREVAKHLGTRHTELRVSATDALAVIPKLSQMYDEPFGDSSQIPTHLVCALTRQHVTVCLSGDAGDELFGGYNRYLWAPALWRRIGWLPVPIRRQAAQLVLSVSAAQWDEWSRALGGLLPKRGRVSQFGDKLHKLAEVLGAGSPQALYAQLCSPWRGPLPLQHPQEPSTLITTPNDWPKLPTFVQQMMAVDSLTYLTDDILVKVDRAAMAASLETRAPFLDERVMRLAWSLPMHQKIRHGQGKWLLRQLLDRCVPRALVDRPKQGFGIPLDAWLRGPLKDWAQSLMSGPESHDLLGPDIQRMWQSHLAGTNRQHGLWNVLMLLAWREHWRAPSFQKAMR